MKRARKNDMRRSFTLKERFSYWFDNRMSKGSLGFIRILIAASVILAVLIAGLIILFGFNEEGETASVFWDSIATVLNAWMPYFSDGTPGYLILMSVTAIAGVLFTSVLIGIITSAIEEKIGNLKKGNSLVLEKGHIVVLGFYPGEYTLLNQLILAAAEEPACIVLAEDMEREEMEQDIDENLDVPKNVRIVCRTVDITDPASIEKCSVETCRTVIVSPTDDMRTIKAVLAVSALLEEKGAPEIRVNAVISRNEFRFPPSLAKAHNITTLQTNSILAKMIAHSCTQTGLSQTFREVFNFEGEEFYLADLSGFGGLTFEETVCRVDAGVAAGIQRGDEIILNPPAGFELQEEDRVLVFAEERDTAKLTAAAALQGGDTGSAEEEQTYVTILGINETLPVILNELPPTVVRAELVGQAMSEAEQTALRSAVCSRGLRLEFSEGDLASEEFLSEVAVASKHIVVLNDHEKESEEADMEVIFLLLNLRDLRKRLDLDFNITVEMRKECNQQLVGHGDHTDFLVSSNMSSLILAQLSERPELIGIFREILSNEGNELYLKEAGKMQLTGTRRIREIRRNLIRQGYILLGHLDAGKHSAFDLYPDEEVTLSEKDDLIVLGRN